MSNLKELVVEHQMAPALIIDDGYDDVPKADEIEPDDIDLATERLASLDGDPGERLAAGMATAALGDAEYDRALETDEVVALLWQMDVEGLLPAELSEQLFTGFKADQASKRGQLKKLEDFLKGVGIKFETEGREHGALGDAKLVFLDLYLGVTSKESALKEAANRIGRLVADKSEHRRPVVIVMSTMTGAKLQDLAHLLQQEAGLLGCKFRVVSKPEFDAVLEPTLQQILDDRVDTTKISEWIDMWDGAIGEARRKFLKDVRMLDLSDYAYLKKYRLEAEGMGLGTYLVPLLLDYLSYCAEDRTGIASAAADLNALDIAASRRHLMPSPQTAVFAHARSFHNERYIEGSGTQFDDPRKSLELGDVIVKITLGDGDPPELDGVNAMVVLSQSCDTQQDNTDAFLLLKGVIRKRDWLANVAKGSLRTDVFIWRGSQYLIDWEKSKSTAVSFATAKGWLRKGGSHHRIARFRTVEALRLQQVFASNLTRVGTLVTPASATPVELSFLVRAAEAGQHETLVKFAATSRMAAVIAGREMKAAAEGDGKATRKSDMVNKLVFSDRFGDEFIQKLTPADLQLVDAQLRPGLEKLKNSTADLECFNVPVKLTEKLQLAGIPISIIAEGNEPSKLPAAYFLIREPGFNHVFPAGQAA